MGGIMSIIMPIVYISIGSISTMFVMALMQVGSESERRAEQQLNQLKKEKNLS